MYKKNMCLLPNRKRQMKINATEYKAAFVSIQYLSSLSKKHIISQHDNATTVTSGDMNLSNMISIFGVMP